MRSLTRGADISTRSMRRQSADLTTSYVQNRTHESRGGGESRPIPHLVGEDEPTMGSPSDKRRSARRPGKQQRARAKNRLRYGFGIRRGGYWSSAWGAGTETAYFGRKKQLRHINVSRGAWGGKPLSHLNGESVEPER